MFATGKSIRPFCAVRFDVGSGVVVQGGGGGGGAGGGGGGGRGGGGGMGQVG